MLKGFEQRGLVGPRRGRGPSLERPPPHGARAGRLSAARLALAKPRSTPDRAARPRTTATGWRSDAHASRRSLVHARQQSPITSAAAPARRHGLGGRAPRRVYEAEYGWDERFEALVAEIVGTVHRRLRPGARALLDRRAGWRARRLRLPGADTDEMRAGCACSSSTPQRAASASAQRLVDECMRFARQAGYRGDHAVDPAEPRRRPAYLCGGRLPADAVGAAPEFWPRPRQRVLGPFAGRPELRGHWCRDPHRRLPRARLRPAAEPQPTGPTESPDQALCRLIETAAAANSLPADFLTRLIWRESSFRPQRDEHGRRAGHRAVHARHGGRAGPASTRTIPSRRSPPRRISSPSSTGALAASALPRRPIMAGRPASPTGSRGGARACRSRRRTMSSSSWARRSRSFAGRPSPPSRSRPRLPDRNPPSGCLALAVDLRRATPARLLAESPSRLGACSCPARSPRRSRSTPSRAASSAMPSIIGDTRPMVIGTRLRFRGSRALLPRARPAATRAEANALCARIHKAGGACIVLRS